MGLIFKDPDVPTSPNDFSAQEVALVLLKSMVPSAFTFIVWLGVRILRVAAGAFDEVEDELLENVTLVLFVEGVEPDDPPPPQADKTTTSASKQVILVSKIFNID